MAAGADKRAPGVFIHRNAAADHFVNITYGKCDVVKSTFAVGQLQ